MDRSDIFNEINRIREQQDANWPRDERRKVMYSFIPPHLVVLQKQVEKLRDEWYTSKTEDSIERLKHIAAAAVRALEEVKTFQ